MVRRFLVTFLATLAVGCATSPKAGAQLLGSLSTAAAEEVGAKKVGGYLGLTGDFVSLMGQFRYGVAPSFDLGVKAAYVDFSNNAGSSVAFNADAKVQLLDVYLQDPVDLAIGPEITYFQFSDVTNWYFGGFIALSKEYSLDNGRPLTPYTRVGARMQRVESPAGDSDEFDVGFAGGVEYGISGYTTIFGEVIIEDSGTGMYVGAQYQLP